MEPLRHGYTNRTVGDGRTVVKRYDGPDAAARCQRERRMLGELAGVVPVPPLLGSDAESVRMGFVAGVHGQELMKAGRAVGVMRACGEVLRLMRDAPAPAGTGLVHGDFGPNNVLIDPVAFTVTAVLDWEFSYYGDPVTDLAWCEWVVRTHHAEDVAAIPELHAAWGLPVPAWPVRRAAMVARCEAYRDFNERWAAGGSGVRRWEGLIAATSAWSE
ncbi:hypothetical protein GCM10009830_48340 [Glycomyces endophyticus]|uniref:Aminoglycoside phosphotransferase domain-containing protein n=1 Tax=Glycomyces endophyticus TaxID=480996 RepID=A0ABN2HWW3_9ACTN